MEFFGAPMKRQTKEEFTAEFMKDAVANGIDIEHPYYKQVLGVMCERFFLLWSALWDSEDASRPGDLDTLCDVPNILDKHDPNE